MPTDDRIWLNDDHGVVPTRQHATKEDPEEPVARREWWASSLLFEYSELLSQRGVLDGEIRRAAEAGDGSAEQLAEGASHGRRLGQSDGAHKAPFLSDMRMFGELVSQGDAKKLAVLLRTGIPTEVRAPTRIEESVRDLCEPDTRRRKPRTALGMT